MTAGRGSMRRRGGAALAGLLVVGVLMVASVQEASAQHRRTDDGPPRGWVGINLIGADAVGEFGENVDGAIGGQLDGRFAIDPIGVLSLRMDAGFMVYGHERQALCFPPPIGCRIGADLTTTNQIAYLGAGPEIGIPGPLNPYVFGTVGLSWFSTSSSLSGLDNHHDENLFETRHYSDVVIAGRLGGGIRTRVGSTGSGPVMLDLGFEYHRNGVAEYLREGDIIDHPDGSITLLPNRTEANLYSFRVGVSFGFGGGGDDHRHDHDHRDGHRGKRGR